MSNPLDEYYIDYLESNGAYMKLRKTSDTGFRSDDFQELQLKMIQSNNIPRLLPMSFEEVNDQTTVFYKIEGLRRLRPFSKERPLTMQEYYSLFINIIQALQDSNNNMLSDHRFVLHEDFIFIGNGYHQVYLTYLPLKEAENNKSVYESLKELLLNMASEVQGLNGVQFKMILSYIKDSGFSLQGIKELLSRLQKSSQQHPEEETDHKIESDNNKEDMIKIKKVRKLPPLSSKYKLYSILFGVLLLAMVWKLYETSTNTAMLIVSSILSVAVIAGVYVYWFVWRPGVEPIITEKEVKVKKKPMKQAQSKQVKEANRNGKSEAEELQPVEAIQPAVKESNYQIEEELSFANAESAAAVNNDYSEVNSSDSYGNQLNDQTMLLDENEMLPQNSGERVNNYLVIEREGIEENIELDTDNFIIGRAEKGTNLCEKGVGISRLHVEFIKLSDTYGIKDLGAKNGTYINNEKIIPYKILELSNEDTIQIGKTIYIYKVS
ncbi:hypothetical protein CIL05_13420 [Virgibacillus profundi]|uniref:FHA domain-containing protein n=1 Tax=Virgibacillus profundi TaxID=2024555 RepID=A0A2A2ICX0_9BACI|nr:DUF6382 domain-containing protein [Virgibacillus profundi]PAV28975.1 hypothetical protein CIL05_13420 [Virgibacillus profundi]PXY53143.1 FHA domain-containing protein [Virgibacillus profundi]